MYERTSSRNRLLGAIALSVAAHLCFVPVVVSMWPDSDAAEEVRFSSVTLVPMVAPERTPEPEEPDAELPQFVELPVPEEESESPPDASFADRFDRSVERETVAEDWGDASLAASTSAARRGREGGEGERSRAAAMPNDDATGGVQAVNESGERRPDSQQEDSLLPTHIETGATPTIGEGAPTAVSPEGEGLDLTVFNATGVAALTRRQGARLDHIELEESNRTMLNSARNIYWSFFNRMKGQVRGEWDPVGVYRLADPSGRRYRRLDRYTVLAVTLEGDGSLAEAAVERSCGLDFLDQEAVRAFRSASPFPNVPEGLKDEEGYVDVRFGFLLSLSGAVHIERIPEF